MTRKEAVSIVKPILAKARAEWPNFTRHEASITAIARQNIKSTLHTEAVLRECYRQAINCRAR